MTHKISIIAACCAAAFSANAGAADAAAGTDMTARILAQKLGEKYGQQFVVDNRTGAGGAIGVDTVAKAVPDGYTIGLISASNSVGAATNPGLPYDMQRDLQGISQATSLFYV